MYHHDDYYYTEWARFRLTIVGAENPLWNGRSSLHYRRWRWIYDGRSLPFPSPANLVNLRFAPQVKRNLYTVGPG